MPHYIKKFNKQPFALPDTGGSDQFPLENRVASLPAGQTLGHYTNGETIPFSTCTTLQEVLDLLCISTLYPSFTNPSITGFSLSGTNYNSTIEVGTTIPNLQGSVTFNQGAIIPLYPSTPAPGPFGNAPRSGPATNYLFGGNLTGNSGSNLSTPTSVVVQNGTNTSSVQVSYSQGVQPYNSAQGTVDSNNTPYVPYPAGNLSLNATFQGKYRIFYGPAAGDHADGSVDTRSLLSVFPGASSQIISLSPGTVHKDFYLYIPNSLGWTLKSAFTTNNENVLPNYTLGYQATFFIPDMANNLVSYKRYRMHNDAPYVTAPTHNLTIGV